MALLARHPWRAKIPAARDWVLLSCQLRLWFLFTEEAATKVGMPFPAVVPSLVLFKQSEWCWAPICSSYRLRRRDCKVSLESRRLRGLGGPILLVMA
jgi:hypothetical protein